NLPLLSFGSEEDPGDVEASLESHADDRTARTAESAARAGPAAARRGYASAATGRPPWRAPSRIQKDPKDDKDNKDGGNRAAAGESRVRYHGRVNEDRPTQDLLDETGIGRSVELRPGGQLGGSEPLEAPVAADFPAFRRLTFLSVVAGVCAFLPA